MLDQRGVIVNTQVIAQFKAQINALVNAHTNSQGSSQILSLHCIGCWCYYSPLPQETLWCLYSVKRETLLRSTLVCFFQRSFWRNTIYSHRRISTATMPVEHIMLGRSYDVMKFALSYGLLVKTSGWRIRRCSVHAYICESHVESETKFFVFIWGSGEESWRHKLWPPI